MKPNFSKLLDNKTFLMAFSLLLAAISWMLVVTYISTIESDTIHNVPVDFTAQQDTYLAPNSLKVVNREEMKVQVSVKADRKILNELKQKPEELYVYADLSEVQKGTYDVPLIAEVPGIKGVTILSITPPTVTLRIDQQTTKTFDITPEIIGLSVPDTYVAQSAKISLNPSAVTITGPDTDIQRIDRCVATVTYTEPLTKTDKKTSELKLFSADGTELPTDSLVMGTKTVDITVPVYKLKELKIKFDYTGYPQDFPLEDFQYTLSTETITVAGPESVVEKLGDEWSIGYVALNEIDVGRILTFEVSLPNGVDPIDVPDSVTVAFDLDDIASATFNVPSENIFLKNVPANYEATLMTKSINNVRLLGDKDVLETLTAQDIVAEADLSNKEPSSGPYNLPVTISAPGKGFVWAVNTPGDPYTAVVTVKDKNS